MSDVVKVPDELLPVDRFIVMRGVKHEKNTNKLVFY